MRDRFGVSGTSLLLFGGGLAGGLYLFNSPSSMLMLGAVAVGAVLYLKK